FRIYTQPADHCGADFAILTPFVCVRRVVARIIRVRTRSRRGEGAAWWQIRSGKSEQCQFSISQVGELAARKLHQAHICGGCAPCALHIPAEGHCKHQQCSDSHSGPYQLGSYESSHSIPLPARRPWASIKAPEVRIVDNSAATGGGLPSESYSRSRTLD